MSAANWIGPNEEIVAHLRRDSERGDGSTADWLVSVRESGAAHWEVVTRYGPTSSKKGAAKVLKGFATQRNAWAEANEQASRKLRDHRYAKVHETTDQPAPSQSETTEAMRRLAIGAEVELSKWDTLLPRLAPLGLVADSDTTWQMVGTGHAVIAVRRVLLRIYLSGFIAVDDAESRPLFAAAALVTGGRITNARGEDFDLEEWVKEARDALSEPAYDLAADFGFLPKKVNYAALAASNEESPWAVLV